MYKEYELNCITIFTLNIPNEQHSGCAFRNFLVGENRAKKANIDSQMVERADWMNEPGIENVKKKKNSNYFQRFHSRTSTLIIPLKV